MTQQERRYELIRWLLRENPQYRDMEIPQSADLQRQLLHTSQHQKESKKPRRFLRSSGNTVVLFMTKGFYMSRSPPRYMLSSSRSPAAVRNTRCLALSMAALE